MSAVRPTGTYITYAAPVSRFGLGTLAEAHRDCLSHRGRAFDIDAYRQRLLDHVDGEWSSGVGTRKGIVAALPAKFNGSGPQPEQPSAQAGHRDGKTVAGASRDQACNCFGRCPGRHGRGMAEPDPGQAPSGRVHRPGGGRKRPTEIDRRPRLALLALVEPDERGDPMSLLRLTPKSIRKQAAELTRQCHRAFSNTVAGLLREEGSGLQANTNPTKVLSALTGTASTAASTSRCQIVLKASSRARWNSGPTVSVPWRRNRRLDRL